MAKVGLKMCFLGRGPSGYHLPHTTGDGQAQASSSIQLAGGRGSWGTRYEAKRFEFYPESHEEFRMHLFCVPTAGCAYLGR